MNEQLFELINASQDGAPLRRYLDRCAGEFPRVGDAVSALICAALSDAETADDVARHLRYAEHEIRSARLVAEDFAGE